MKLKHNSNDFLGRIIGSGVSVAHQALPPSEYFLHNVTEHSEFREVFLNGEREPLAVEAHVGQRWIRRYRATALGTVMHGIDSAPQFELIYGDVKILYCGPGFIRPVVDPDRAAYSAKEARGIALAAAG